MTAKVHFWRTGPTTECGRLVASTSGTWSTFERAVLRASAASVGPKLFEAPSGLIVTSHDEFVTCAWCTRTRASYTSLSKAAERAHAD